MTGRGVNLSRADSDRRFFRDIDRQTGYRTRSMLAAPLRDGEGRIFGVVQVLNAARGHFTAEDEELLVRLCAEAALAIETTSLYPQVRPRGQAARDEGERLPVGYRYNRIVGESPAMQHVYTLVERAARTAATVLLRGESGTGKELIARAIHYNRPRRDGPFVKVDCTTIPPTLMENELFGHERGAYTGATQRVLGKCELAAGGTLFIDELGELPLGLQGKLLRFIQDREFERVGGSRTLTADVRVVAATHRDLEELRFSRGALLRLQAHVWRGNIRELENCIESTVVLCDGPEIKSEQLALPPASASGTTPPAAPAGFVPATLATVERDHIARTLKHTGGNRSRAAELLGIGRNTLLRQLKAYGLT